jgi:hypothetical protein
MIAALERAFLAEEGLRTMFDKSGIGILYPSYQNGRIQNYVLDMYDYKEVEDVISAMQEFMNQNPKYAGLIKINPPSAKRF